MAMRRSGTGSGGGMGMNKNVRPGVRTGERGRAINPGGVGQIGQSQGDHVTGRDKTLRRSAEPVRGDIRPAGTPGAVPLGNAVALNVGKGGPGTGRTVMKTGGQSVHGNVDPGGPRIADTKGEWPDKRGS